MKKILGIRKIGNKFKKKRYQKSFDLNFGKQNDKSLF